MTAELLSERRGSTLVLTISDPPTRNTLSAQVIAGAIESLGVAEANPEIRCVVLQGAGGHFCAGGNLQGLKARALSLKHAAKKSELLRAGVNALHAMGDKDFLAALNAIPSLKTGRPKGGAA